MILGMITNPYIPNLLKRVQEEPDINKNCKGLVGIIFVKFPSREKSNQPHPHNLEGLIVQDRATT